MPGGDCFRQSAQGEETGRKCSHCSHLKFTQWEQWQTMENQTGKGFTNSVPTVPSVPTPFLLPGCRALVRMLAPR
jgi:hypothetical protein